MGKFLRLGREGYTELCRNRLQTAQTLREFLANQKCPNGKTRFIMLDAASKGEPCLPVVTAMLNPDANMGFDDIDLQHILSEHRWYVSGYHMSYEHPNTGKTMPLFTDH